MIAIIAASVLSPFFLKVTPEVQSTYISLGKLMEDRPMQVTSIRAGFDAGAFGRFGFRNRDVSSLTDRRHDAHRHALYHFEFGPTWEYDIKLADDWTLKSDLTRSWTFYRGFEKDTSNRDYHWWQIDQWLDNPYIVPFYRMRRCFRGNEYLYFKAGVRRRFNIWESLYATPSVFVEGGNGRNYKRIVGAHPDGKDWSDGVSSVTFRLELGWRFNENLSVFGFVEQYEIVGQAARHAISESTYRCAHNDWTHGGFGCRLSF